MKALGSILLAVVIALGIAGAMAATQLFGDSKEEDFKAFVTQMEFSRKMMPDLNVTSPRDGKGHETVLDLGVERMRSALADPSKARFDEAFVSFNQKTGAVHVCGMFETPDRTGRLMIPDAFYTKMDLGETLATSKAERPVLYSALLTGGQSYTSGMSGEPGETFYRACGNGFRMDMIKTFNRG